MNKILIFTSVLFFITSSLFAQTWNCVNGVCIDPGTGTGQYSTLQACQNACSHPTISLPIVITNPIDCFGGLASIRINVNQTSPPVPFVAIVGYSLGNAFIPFGSVYNNAQGSPVVNLNNTLFARDWIIRVVDSVSYFAAFPAGSGNLNNMTGVFDQYGADPNNLFTITQPPQLVASNTLVDSNLCAGDCNAQQEIITIGGTQPYYYTWADPNGLISGPNNLLTTDTLKNLCAGSHTLLITDDNGCQTGTWQGPSFQGQYTNYSPSDNSFVILEPLPLTPAGTVQDISCFGANDGQMQGLNLTSGGTSPYQFAVDNGPFGPANSINSITGGPAPGLTHTIHYQDANGCSTSVSYNFIEPPELNLSLASNSPNMPTCYGYNDGGIALNISGGVGNETYSIDGVNFSSSNAFNALYGNSNYVVTVKDGNLCEDTIHVFLTEPSEIIYTDSVSVFNTFQVSCHGASDGLIKIINPAGGAGTPYQFSVDGGTSWSGNPIFTGLSSGTYNVDVKDALNCQSSSIIVLNSPPRFTLLTNSVLPLCNGDANGSISVNSNGINPIVYQINSSGYTSSNNFANLSSGTYTLQSIDGNNCIADTIINLQDPMQLTVSNISSTAEFCNNQLGVINLNVSGGTPFIGSSPYQYSWTNSTFTFGSTSEPPLGSLNSGSYQCIITDANTCSVTITEVVLEEIPFALSFITSPTCPGQSAGTAEVIVTPTGSNTLGTISYLWDSQANSQTTAIATNLPLGSFAVDVTVNPGNFQATCTISEIANIDTTSLSANISNVEVTQISCHDANDGELTIHAVGGTQPYTFSINSNPSQSDSIFSNLNPGVYIAEVQDFTGCIDQDTINIINPDSLYIDTTIINPIRCHGESNASVQAIVAIGGTPPYQYSVNGGLLHSNVSYFTNYASGVYTIEVQDFNNCFSQDLVIISEPDILNANITPSLWNNYQVRCFGDTNAFANISALGGVSPYNYICINSSGDTVHQGNNSSVSYLRNDTYDFYVIDTLGCVYNESISYHEPTLIEHNFILTHVTCNGWSNGSLIDSVYGGVGGSTNTYTYEWTALNNTNILSTNYFVDSIPVGQYEITVRDMNNCSSSAISDSINSDGALNISINTMITTNVSCYNYCDGIISINPIGGIPNIDPFGNPIYYYLWDDTLNQTTQSAMGLCVDNNTNSTTYSCIVTDQQGCTDTISHTIIQQELISVSASIVSQISCFNKDDGELTVSASGGAGGFLYMWNNNSPLYSSSPNNNNIYAGSYIITVKDQNGCYGSDSITINQPSEMTLFVSDTDISCYGYGDGKILADAEGGTPFLGIPPEYEYILYDDSGLQIDIETVDVSELENLTPGIYSVVAKDMNGCIVESNSIYISQPGDSLTVLFSTQDATCAQDNGQATVYVYGGTPQYQYNWDNGQTGVNIIGLSSGYYPITITDNNNCVIRDSAFVIGVQNVFLPDNVSQIEYTICLGDSVFIDVDERSNSIYNWENGSNIADRWVYPDKRYNEYILTIKDNGCPDTYSVSAIVNVNFVDAKPTSEPGVLYGEHPVIVKGEQIQIFSNNNYCDTYLWKWDPDEIINQSFNDDPEFSTMYYIHVDSAGCLGYDSIYIVVGVLPYEGITPNNDGYNDTWKPVDIESYPDALVQIFNRWGAIIFESKGGLSYKPWDGTNNGKELPVGTYYYIIDLNTNDQPQTGPITIIR